MDPIKEAYTTQIKEQIDSYGQDVMVFYYTTVQPSVRWDPINDEPLNAASASPDGWTRVEQQLVFKAAVQTFVTNKSKIERGLQAHGIEPDDDIRVTFWLDDVLINIHSANGTTYLDNCDKFKVYGKFYKPKDRHRTGIDSRPYVLIVNGNEIKG